MTEDRSLVPAAPGSISFGQTDLRPGDFIPPRVKIVQLMSDENQTGLAKPGDFWNTLTSESYGSTLKFLPIQQFMNRVLLVRDERKDEVEAALSDGRKGKDAFHFAEGNSTLKCRSLDMQHGQGEPGIDCDACPLSKWRPGNLPPLCTEVYNVAALHEDGDLIIIQFQKSSAKAGKRMFSMMRFVTPGTPPWTRFYEATTHDETIKGKGTFAVPVVAKTPEVPPTELMRQAQSWFTQLSGLGPIDVTPADDDEASIDDTVGDGDSPF